MEYLRKICLIFFPIIISISGPSCYGGERQVAFGQSELFVLSAGHRYRFDVDVAATAPQHARGVMFRKSMAARKGMLFLFKESRMITMWMKNTFMPLDMIFINSKGVIVHIAISTVPHSLDHISSMFPVNSVLEVNAGVTGRLNIKIGDKVEHPFFVSSPQ